MLCQELKQRQDRSRVLLGWSSAFTGWLLATLKLADFSLIGQAHWVPIATTGGSKQPGKPRTAHTSPIHIVFHRVSTKSSRSLSVKPYLKTSRYVLILIKIVLVSNIVSQIAQLQLWKPPFLQTKAQATIGGWDRSDFDAKAEQMSEQICRRLSRFSQDLRTVIRM